VLWQLARTGRYEPIKTDRVLREAPGRDWLSRLTRLDTRKPAQ
jgi:hypothetical protein